MRGMCATKNQTSISIRARENRVYPKLDRRTNGRKDNDISDYRVALLLKRTSPFVEVMAQQLLYYVIVPQIYDNLFHILCNFPKCKGILVMVKKQARELFCSFPFLFCGGKVVFCQTMLFVHLYYTLYPLILCKNKNNISVYSENYCLFLPSPFF